MDPMSLFAYHWPWGQLSSYPGGWPACDGTRGIKHKPTVMKDEGTEWTEGETEWHVWRCPACGHVGEFSG